MNLQNFDGILLQIWQCTSHSLLPAVFHWCLIHSMCTHSVKIPYVLNDVDKHAMQYIHIMLQSCCCKLYFQTVHCCYSSCYSGSAASFIVLCTTSSASNFNTPIPYTLLIHYTFIINLRELVMNFYHQCISCIQRLNCRMDFIPGPPLQSSSYVHSTD